MQAAAAAHRIQSSSRPALWAAGVLAAAAALLVAVGVVPLPKLDGPLEDASRTLGAWAYPAVAGFAFLETGAFVGLLVPGETAVVVGGVVAERGGVELVPLVGFVWLAAAGGDLVSFLLGRRLGRPFLERHGRRFQLTPDRLARVDTFYERHGGKAVLLGRFTGLIRAVSPFVAGAPAPRARPGGRGGGRRARRAPRGRPRAPLRRPRRAGSAPAGRRATGPRPRQ